MMSGRLAGCVAWRREDWPSCQAARRSLRAFQTSPHPVELNMLGPPCLSACLRSAVSTDGQSAFADGPVAFEQTGGGTTAILIQCCLKLCGGFARDFSMNFPAIRMRRMRRDAFSRALMREHTLLP